MQVNLQLGAAINQYDKPIAFYSRKQNSAQANYWTTERELLSIVETLIGSKTIILGQQIKYIQIIRIWLTKHFTQNKWCDGYASLKNI